MTLSVAEEDIKNVKNIKSIPKLRVEKGRKTTYEMMVNNNELSLKAPEEQEIGKVVC